jgi:hypothetical protein
MAGEPHPQHLSPLERLDLELAARLAAARERAGASRLEDLAVALAPAPAASDAEWIAATLGLRGYVVAVDDVQRLLSGLSAKLRVGQQEHALVVGMARVLRSLRDRAAAGRPPDGWFLVELFRQLTCEVPRFRNNELRRDEPWDSVLYVSYPQPALLRGLLDTFDAAHRYRDVPALFDALHPVRRGFRLLWRFARVAPFPDLNLVMATIGMSSYLAAEGYPLFCPRRADRELLTHLVSGPPPRKAPLLEKRLLEQVVGGAD